MPNRYKKHMQHVHQQSTANDIEMAALLLIEDIAEYLIANEIVWPNSKTIKDIKNIIKYEYNANITCTKP